jgi:hypothetical protein
MADHPGEGDPNVTVKGLLMRGAGSRVVVSAGSFDAGTVAWRGRVVQRKQPPRHRRESVAQFVEEDGRTASGVLTQRTEQMVGAAEVVRDAGRPEPRGDGAAPVGQEQAQEKGWDEIVLSAVQKGRPGGQDGSDRVG